MLIKLNHIIFKLLYISPFLTHFKVSIWLISKFLQLIFYLLLKLLYIWPSSQTLLFLLAREAVSTTNFSELNAYFLCEKGEGACVRVNDMFRRKRERGQERAREYRPVFEVQYVWTGMCYCVRQHQTASLCPQGCMCICFVHVCVVCLWMCMHLVCLPSLYCFCLDEITQRNPSDIGLCHA